MYKRTMSELPAIMVQTTSSISIFQRFVRPAVYCVNEARDNKRNSTNQRIHEYSVSMSSGGNEIVRVLDISVSSSILCTMIGTENSEMGRDAKAVNTRST